MTKTVIIVWKQVVKNLKPTEKDNFWGFGDMIRGVCGIVDVCEELGILVFVDTRHHPVGSFFKYNTHTYEELIDNNIDNINIDLFNNRESIKTHLTNIFKTKDIYYNAIWVNPYIFTIKLSNYVKQFIKTVLTPTDTFQAYIDKHLPSYKYDIIHFRLGDKYFDSNDKSNFKDVMNKLQNTIGGGDILISDSKSFKDIVYKEMHDKIVISDIKPCHIGYEKDNYKIQETLYEYILLTKAQTIKTYSVYGWVSGFTNSIHKIYDVPLNIIT